MSTQENKDTTRRLVEEVWNRGNWSVIEEVLAPNFVGYISGSPEPFHGQEGYRSVINAYRTAFPDLHFNIEDLIADGDKVAFRYTATGTQRGDLSGIPPTNKSATVPGMVILRYEGGKLTEQWVNLDLFGLMVQLGVIPAPGQAG